mmetsp:Transcript_77418/g.160871  ORF Transcript_77418/g.160871 Transcript_77418/m.160871 type:complete len:214 (+) Transcript_77418:8109-8750(+)
MSRPTPPVPPTKMVHRRSDVLRVPKGTNEGSRCSTHWRRCNVPSLSICRSSKSFPKPKTSKRACKWPGPKRSDESSRPVKMMRPDCTSASLEAVWSSARSGWPRSWENEAGSWDRTSSTTAGTWALARGEELAREATLSSNVFTLQTRSCTSGGETEPSSLSSSMVMTSMALPFRASSSPSLGRRATSEKYGLPEQTSRNEGVDIGFKVASVR